MTRHLATWGWVEWATARDLVDGSACAWADLDGWHAGEPAPTQPPACTHLWGWSDRGLVRMRVDGRRALVVALVDRPDALPDPIEVREVTTDSRPVVLWAPGDTTIPPAGRAHLSGEWTAEEVTDATSLTFYRRTSDG